MTDNDKAKEFIVDNFEHLKGLVKPVYEDYKDLLKDTPQDLHVMSLDAFKRVLKFKLVREIDYNTGVGSETILIAIEDFGLERFL